MEGSGPGVPLLIWLVITAIVVIALAGFVVTRSRARRLPPPAAPPEELPAPVIEAPPEPPAAVEAPVTEAPFTEAPIIETDAPPAEAPPEPATVEVPEASPRPRGRVRSIGSSLRRIFKGTRLTPEDWDELEEILLRSDVGVVATTKIVADLRAQDPADGMRALREELLRILGDADRTLARKQGLTVWLVTGVNGSGKTTTIGKLAAKLNGDGASVVLAAADTFRAAADEQLQRWADRAHAQIVKHRPGADPAAVVFDGVAAARARSADVLIVDTAGRLQTKRDLMDELAKINRVLEREAGAADEVLLVLDATTGQNGLQQARAFAEATPVSGIVLTKLDGTAKGGIVVAVQQELGLPVKLVGLGEGIDDLAPFDPAEFVDQLLEQEPATGLT